MESDHGPAGKAPPQAPLDQSLEQPLQEPLQEPPKEEPPQAAPALAPAPAPAPAIQAPPPETLSTDEADTGTVEPAPPSPNPAIAPTGTSHTTHLQEESPIQPQPEPQPQHEQQQQQQQQQSHELDASVNVVDPDRQKGPGGANSSSSNVDPSDRVFPIRSVISVDHSQPTPWMHSRDTTEPDYFPRPESTWDGRRRASMSMSVSASTPRLTTNMSTTNVSTTNVSGELSQPPSVLSPTSPRDTDFTPASRSHRGNTITSQPDYLGGQPPKSERPPVSATPSALNFRDGTPDDKSSRMSIGAASSVLNDGDSQLSDLPGSLAGDPDDAGFVTTRFQHVTTEDGHAVITGRDGTLQRCEDEPIHTPGAVQGFGLLVVLREDAEGRLSVRIVSENSKQIIGYTPHELFNLGSFTDVLSEEQAENLLDHIDFVRDEESDPATSGPDVFSISLRPPRSKSKSIRLWCAMHLNKAHPDLIICEFEPEDDQLYPIRPPDELTPEEPKDTLYQNPTVEQLFESTEIGSKPLRVLRSARKRRGEAGAMQVFDIMSQVQEQFASAPNLEKFLKTLVGIVKELTGFHRIMIYQFDAAFNGKVVTELVDPAQTRDLYHGLHFPASDIPKQARELYKLNKVRLLYDRDLQSARLVCRTVEDLEQPLDMSHAYLRAMSPIHVKYLANMAVRSSMSISINTFGELWGLISCHSYGPKGMRVAFPIRKMCRMIGDTASRNIERLSYASRLQARKLINTMPTDKNPSGYIIASSEDLLKLFDADFGMLSIGEETKVLGKIAQSQEALALLEYLRLRNFTAVLTTQDVGQDFPDLRYTPGFSVIAGLLYVPLSVGGHDFIVFFRKGQVREVNWAGNPYEKIIREGTANYLEPRSSFKAWRETVIGKCREWSEEQVETAAVLCLVYGKFIEVWRQKEAALQSSRLTRLLLANSAHEVRTPLNAIINYLEIALEGSIDHETRENLAKSHSASKSLIYVINDLLDLTKTEEGRELIKDEIMDLPACLLEATDPFKVDAKRKGISYEVIQHPGIPQHVHGDYRRIRQAIANITANAVQSTSVGSVKVECFVVEVHESRVRVEIVVHDTGCGMSNAQLDNLFQDLEQVSSADLGGEPEAMEVPFDKTEEGRILGLGLAVVARIVRNMDGQLRLKSEEGLGSRFVIQLPFELPSSDTLEKLNENTGKANIAPEAASLASVTKSMPPTQAGEMMLVDRGAGNTAHGSNRSITKTRSFDDTNSVNSIKSNGSGGARSNKSDADRLIDAIQSPFDPTDADKDLTIQQNNSKGRRPLSNTSLSSFTITDTPQAVGAQPGAYPVQGSNVPVKPVKIPDDYSDQTTAPQNAQPSRVLFELPPDSSQEKDEVKPKAPANAKPDKLRVLIAEDDPINMKVLTKRLEKTGHEVFPAVNGEDCLTVYKEKSQEFDVVLMDMQMPIVDGLTSTKLIRACEKSGDCPGLSPLGLLNGHIPIFAVSASLVEKDKSVYTDAGFDGWILKPIDYKRLNVLLDGIADDDVREKCLYQPGEWERGGWFARRATE